MQHERIGLSLGAAGLGVSVIVGDGAGEPGLREVPLAREEMLGAEHMYGVKIAS